MYPEDPTQAPNRIPPIPTGPAAATHERHAGQSAQSATEREHIRHALFDVFPWMQVIDADQGRFLHGRRLSLDPGGAQQGPGGVTSQMKQAAIRATLEPQPTTGPSTGLTTSADTLGSLEIALVDLDTALHELRIALSPYLPEQWDLPPMPPFPPSPSLAVTSLTARRLCDAVQRVQFDTHLVRALRHSAELL